jgi:hypothetical protein
MDRRRRDPHINQRMAGLANDRTIAKIRRGEILTDSKAESRGRAVYEQIDRMLRWHVGDAETCARTGVLPRPLEGVRDNGRTRYLEVAAVLSRASTMLLTADSPDDVDPAALAEAERQARKLLEEELQRRKQHAGSDSTSGQRST